MFRSAVLALSLLTFSLLSHAAFSENTVFSDGNKLKSWADASDRVSAGTQTGKDFMNASKFSGYVIGVFDATHQMYCGTENITLGQVVAIVKKYLADHPESWGSSGDAITTKALRSAFPCDKK